jgi:FlaA1/EpsC-like NDP-sugar epimerase
VIQAGAIGGRGEVYVLDMGEPVRIVELARNMIRLSGKQPDTDVEVRFVGVRPGEKLHEELWNEGEQVTATAHPKIQRATRSAIDAAWLDEELAVLKRLVEEGETLELVSRLGAMMRSPRRSGEPKSQTRSAPVTPA